MKQIKSFAKINKTQIHTGTVFDRTGNYYDCGEMTMVRDVINYWPCLF